MKDVMHVYAVIETRPNFLYKSMVAKRGLTNRANVLAEFQSIQQFRLQLDIVS